MSGLPTTRSRPVRGLLRSHPAWLIEKLGDSVAVVQLVRPAIISNNLQQHSNMVDQMKRVQPTDDGEGDEEQGQNVGVHPAKKGRNRQRAPGRVQYVLLHFPGLLQCLAYI